MVFFWRTLIGHNFKYCQTMSYSIAIYSDNAIGKSRAPLHAQRPQCDLGKGSAERSVAKSANPCHRMTPMVSGMFGLGQGLRSRYHGQRARALPVGDPMRRIAGPL